MIRKPNIVKGIPMPLVRALPTIYYYGRYARENIASPARVIFESHIHYLSQAIKKLASMLSDTEMDVITAAISSLSQIQSAQIEDKIYQLSGNLSTIFSAKKDIVKEEFDKEDGVKKSLIELYRATTKIPAIAVIDNNNELEWTDRLAHTLTSSCYYNTIKTRPYAESFADDILKSDFILFASATPQSIHEDVGCLKIYQKPGLILGSLKKDEKLDHQTIRNGSWLKSRGYDVLFKLFSPLRLFTTIDKINIRFLLQD